LLSRRSASSIPVVGDDVVAASSAEGNVAVVKRALTDLASLPDLISEDLVWHFFGSIDGIATDHVGRENVEANFWGTSSMRHTGT